MSHPLRSTLCLAGLGIAMLSCHIGCQANPQLVRLSQKNLLENPDGMPGERLLSRKIDIGHGRTILATLTVTSKGNGELHVPGADIKVYDAHDDGSVFEKEMANITFVDLNGDGYLDVCVIATELITEPEAPIHPGQRTPFAQICLYNPKDQYFHIQHLPPLHPHKTA